MTLKFRKDVACLANKWQDKRNFRPKGSEPRASVLTTMLLRTLGILAGQASYVKGACLCIVPR